MMAALEPMAFSKSSCFNGAQPERVKMLKTSKYSIIAGIVLLWMSGSIHAANFPRVVAFTLFPSATNAPTALPSTQIPDGANLVVKAANTNASNVKIGGVIGGLNFTLLPGNAISLSVTNANAVFIMSATLGDGVECVVEMRSL